MFSVPPAPPSSSRQVTLTGIREECLEFGQDLFFGTLEASLPPLTRYEGEKESRRLPLSGFGELWLACFSLTPPPPWHSSLPTTGGSSSSLAFDESHGAWGLDPLIFLAQVDR